MAPLGSIYSDEKPGPKKWRDLAFQLLLMCANVFTMGPRHTAQCVGWPHLLPAHPALLGSASASAPPPALGWPQHAAGCWLSGRAEATQPGCSQPTKKRSLFGPKNKWLLRYCH